MWEPLVSSVGIISLTFTFNKCPELSSHTSADLQVQAAEIWSAHRCIDSFSVRGLCLYVWTHARVCRRGPTHSFVFIWKLRSRNVCLPAVLSSDSRVGGAHCSPSLTSTHLLHWAKVCVDVCACLHQGVRKRVTQWGSPLALTHFGLLCIFNPSNAKLSVVLFWGTLLKSATDPLPHWERTMECNGSTRGLLNAFQQQGRNGWGRLSMYQSVWILPSPRVCVQHESLCVLQLQGKIWWVVNLVLWKFSFWKPTVVWVTSSAEFPVYWRNNMADFGRSVKCRQWSAFSRVCSRVPLSMLTIRSKYNPDYFWFLSCITQ